MILLNDAGISPENWLQWNHAAFRLGTLVIVGIDPVNWLTWITVRFLKVQVTYAEVGNGSGQVVSVQTTGLLESSLPVNASENRSIVNLVSASISSHYQRGRAGSPRSGIGELTLNRLFFSDTDTAVLVI